ncbi:MAG TPA: hypothetical protein DCR97_10015 [Deltaproteobacteria bacterium]|nr:hypothetical protein [Deltaproteobacteria bacterium]
MSDKQKPTQGSRPANPHRVMTESVNRMMEDFLSAWPMMRSTPFDWGMQEFTPFIDIFDEDTQIRVVAEMPGIRREDLEVTVTRDSLTLKGEKKQKEEDRATCYRERCFGSFERVIPLPCDIDRDNVQAHFDNGILTITMPKSHEVAEHVNGVEIQSG